MDRSMASLDTANLQGGRGIDLRCGDQIVDGDVVIRCMGIYFFAWAHAAARDAGVFDGENIDTELPCAELRGGIEDGLPRALKNVNYFFFGRAKIGAAVFIELDLSLEIGVVAFESLDEGTKIFLE